MCCGVLVLQACGGCVSRHVETLSAAGALQMVSDHAYALLLRAHRGKPSVWFVCVVVVHEGNSHSQIMNYCKSNAS